MVDRLLLVRAYAACEALARSHYENFPVASRLLPAEMRPHLAAVYAFARVADDYADEGDVAPAVRRDQLEGWRARLLAAAATEDLPAATRDDLIFVALGHSIRTRGLPVALLDDLLSAFEQDTMTVRYDSWAGVLEYCRRSADPVGRLVLRIAGYRDEALDRSSDALCTALQLTNFWQDFGRDWRAGRLYVPREVSRARGAEESDLAAGRFTSQWAGALDDAIAFTRDLYAAGRLVCGRVPGRLGFELRATWHGGHLILDRAAARGRSALDVRPALGKADVPMILWRALTWKIGFERPTHRGGPERPPRSPEGLNPR